MRKATLVTAAVGVVLALTYLAEARRYSWGIAAQPGPGLYPMLVGMLLLVSALGIAVETVLGSGTGRVAWPAGRDLGRLMTILAPTAGYVLLLPYLGHPLAGTVLTLIVLHAMGLRRWPVKIAVALAVGLGSQYIFAVLLGVPLPTGFWSR